MDTSATAPDHADLDGIRRQRAELRDSMSALEQALAGAPLRDYAGWAERVHAALTELSADFREHVGFTESSDGLYVDILATAPRLTGTVARLTREHVEITDLLGQLLARTERPEDVDEARATDEVRQLGNALLGVLIRHRQKGSDLVYEAYAFDVGGED